MHSFGTEIDAQQSGPERDEINYKLIFAAQLGIIQKNGTICYRQIGHFTRGSSIEVGKTTSALSQHSSMEGFVV